MKRLWVLLALVFLPALLLSQETAPVTVYFKVAKEFQARQLVGAPIATPYIAGNPDTMQAVSVHGLAKDSVKVQGQPATVWFFTVELLGSNRKYTYYDTLKNSIQHIVPAPQSGDSLGIADSIFYFVLASTVPDGEQFELTLNEIDEVELYPRETAWSSTRVTWDTLTVLSSADTLQALSDTFYTEPVSGLSGIKTLLIDKTPKPGTATIFGVAYQLKTAGSTKWYGDLANSAYTFVLDDSVLMQDTTMAIVGTHIPADSVRYVIYGKSALRAVILKIKLLWRN